MSITKKPNITMTFDKNDLELLEKAVTCFIYESSREEGEKEAESMLDRLHKAQEFVCE